MCTDSIAATLVTGIRGAREVVLEESSHTPAMEETEKYLQAISNFMREAEATQPLTRRALPDAS
jgi:hypothetical protein